MITSHYKNMGTGTATGSRAEMRTEGVTGEGTGAGTRNRAEMGKGTGTGMRTGGGGEELGNSPHQDKRRV